MLCKAFRVVRWKAPPLMAREDVYILEEVLKLARDLKCDMGYLELQAKEGREVRLGGRRYVPRNRKVRGFRTVNVRNFDGKRTKTGAT